MLTTILCTFEGRWEEAKWFVCWMRMVYAEHFPAYFVPPLLEKLVEFVR